MNNLTKSIITASLLTVSSLSMADSMLGLDCSYWKNNAMPVKKLADNDVPKHMVMNVVNDSWRDMPTENLLMMQNIVNTIYELDHYSMEDVLSGVGELCKAVD